MFCVPEAAGIWQVKIIYSILLKMFLRKLRFPSSYQKNDARNILARRQITTSPGFCLLFSVGRSEGDTQTPWWELRQTQGG